MKWFKYLSISCLMLISLFFYYIPVYADGATYSIANNNQCDTYFRSGSSDIYIKITSSNEVRVVGLKFTDYTYFYFVSESSFTASSNISFDSCVVNNNNSSQIYYNGTYYHARNYGNVLYTSDVVPIIDLNIAYNYNTANDNAVYYTFGDGAVEPVIPSTWGNLVDVGYKTELAGNGSNIKNNLDTISWNPYTDENGNYFDDSCYVDIRAVPGYYGASDRQSLLTQTANDFIKELTGSVTLSSIPATLGSYSVSWGSVCDYLSSAYPMSIQALSSLFNDGGSWIKKGWIYQYRLIADGYEGEWNDIYTLTSSGVQNDLTVINVTTIDQSLIDVQITNQEINQNVNIQIEFNDVLIPDIPAPSPTPVPTADPENPCTTCNVEIPDNTDWFLAIINTIRTTINGLKETINGLFSFEVEYLDEVNPEEEKQKFLDINYFGDASQFLQNVSDTWAQIENSPPVLQFDGITIQGETFIPATTINLNTIVEDMGISQYHELAYTMTDGIIYLSLFILVINKIREATKGE